MSTLFPTNSRSNLIGNIKGVIDSVKDSGSPQAVMQKLRDANIQAKLPNGQSVNIDQFVDMMKGKSLQQAYGEFGLDFDNN